MARTDARDRLVAATETLVSGRGIDDLSLREINAAAGVGNASAIQYHFGGRPGLVRAVLDKHHAEVEARRHALLDDYEAQGDGDLRALAAAFVRPLASEVRNADGGAGYLQLLADVMNRPRPAIDPATLEDPSNSTFRWRKLVEPLLPPDAAELHRRFMVIQFTSTELARRARVPSARGDTLFVSQLIDLVAAMLAAPVSDETRRARNERRTRPRTR
jgi:AcrR family transcriptional regulator